MPLTLAAKIDLDHPPEGGHPSEDYNCRCWAEPVNAAENPWKEWVGERRELRDKLAPPIGLKTEPLIEKPELTAGDVARYTAITAAVIVTIRSGGKVPLKTILNIIRTGNLAQSIRRQTIDRHIFKKARRRS